MCYKGSGLGVRGCVFPFGAAPTFGSMCAQLLSHVRLFCDPMDCHLPGSSVHGIFHARIVEWVAISFSRGSSLPRDQIRVSHIVDRHFIV